MPFVCYFAFPSSPSQPTTRENKPPHKKNNNQQPTKKQPTTNDQRPFFQVVAAFEQLLFTLKTQENPLQFDLRPPQAGCDSDFPPPLGFVSLKISHLGHQPFKKKTYMLYHKVKCKVLRTRWDWCLSNIIHTFGNDDFFQINRSSYSLDLILHPKKKQAPNVGTWLDICSRLWLHMGISVQIIAHTCWMVQKPGIQQLRYIYFVQFFHRSRHGEGRIKRNDASDPVAFKFWT